MTSLIFSTISGFSSVGSMSLGLVHAEVIWSKGIYDLFYIYRIDHYKEQTAIGHEFLVLHLRKRSPPPEQKDDELPEQKDGEPPEEVVVRIERRPSTRKVAMSQSSDFWTDDSISQLAPRFSTGDYYHISTTTCDENTFFTVLTMCEICAFIRNAAPIYSLTKAKHCYWFCTAFLLRLRMLQYSTQFTQGRDFDRRARFRGIKLVTEESVEKELSACVAAANLPLPRAPPFMLPRNPFFAAPHRQHGQTWTFDVELVAHTTTPSSVCFTPDGRHLLSGSNHNTICIWDAVSGKEDRQPLKGHTGSVSSVAVSSNGRHIVTASHDATVRIWDMEAGVPVSKPLPGHTEGVTSVAFSPDGSKIVSGSYDHSVRIWDVATRAAVGEPLLGHAGSVWSVAWSPDGSRIVSGSRDRTIRVWDADTGAPVGQPLRRHTCEVNSVAFSPDGCHIVSCSNDRTVCVGDISSGSTLHRRLRNHTYRVYSVAFSPDGRWVASGSWDGSVRIWDSEAGGIGPIARVTVDSWVYSVAWSPESDRIAARCRDGKIRVYRRVT